MITYKRFVISYVQLLLNHPQWLILMVAIVLFVFSYNVMYEFSIKQLNIRLAAVFNRYHALVPSRMLEVDDWRNRVLSKVTFSGDNLLALSSLQKVNISVEDAIILSPLTNCPVDLGRTYAGADLKEMQSYLFKFFNYDLKNSLPKLYFDDISVKNNLIEKASLLSIYALHSEPVRINSSLPYQIVTESNPKLIRDFIGYYNLQNCFGSTYTLVHVSNVLIGLVMFAYCVYVYISIANQYRIRSSFGLVIGWLFNVVTSASMSVNVVTMLHGYSTWKSVLEPTTTFTKLAYIFSVMLISSHSLFKIIDHVTDKKGKLHMQLLSLFINKWKLPLTFPEMFGVVASILTVHLFAKFAVYGYLETVFPDYFISRLSLSIQALILSVIINFVTQLSYLIAILVIDNTRICLSDAIEKQIRENELNSFQSGADVSNMANLYEGTNIFTSYLLRLNWNIRPKQGFKYKLGHYLLKIRYESNPIFTGTSIILLILGVYAQLVVVFPYSLRHLIQPTHIVRTSYSGLYYLEALSILSFILAISFLVFKLTNSSTKNESTKLDLNDFGVEKKVFDNIELKNGHSLDIIKIKTNPNTSFVISIGLDHKINIWSPLARNTKPINIATTCLTSGPVFDTVGRNASSGQVNYLHATQSTKHKTFELLETSNENEANESSKQPQDLHSAPAAKDTLLNSISESSHESPYQVQDDAATAIPLPLHSREFWPINHVNISNDGNYIVLLNQKYGLMKCYERKQLKYIWECELPLEIIDLIVTKKFKILDSFFRKKTVPGFLARKMLQKQRQDKVRRGSNLSLSSLGSSINGNFPPPPSLNVGAQKLDALDDELNKLQKEEFVLMLATGHGLVINCTDGKLTQFNVLASIYPDDPENYKLISAKNIVTPRINDRIIFQVANQDDLIIGTAFNNSWKFRKLPVREGFYNQRAVSPMKQTSSQVYNNNDFASVYDSQVEQTKQAPVISTHIADSKVQINKPTLVTVEFVGMVVRVKNLVADLIDVQTGIILKSFIVGRFKPASFRVSHSKPTHCKFCGCASIQSFSIVYEDFDTSTIILHTFKIDTPRSKSFICLRVERDPREIRCIGFNAVNEHQYWYENIEGWEITDVNMIIGIRKPEEPEEREEIEVTHTYSKPNFNQLIETSGLHSLRNRKVKSPSKQLANTSAELWEGFIITASDGKLITYQLPTTTTINGGSNSLFSKITCIEKYGYKSIIINICSNLEIFYLGNDKLIEDDIYYSGNNADLWGILEDEALKRVLVPNQTINSELLFINKRRRTRERLSQYKQ